jgi:hypothetical protein
LPHGYLRFTKDVDIVIRLLPDNIEKAFTALSSLGYRPNVPITKEQFSNSDLRNSWIRDRRSQQAAGSRGHSAAPCSDGQQRCQRMSLVRGDRLEPYDLGRCAPRANAALDGDVAGGNDIGSGGHASACGKAAAGVQGAQYPAVANLNGDDLYPGNHPNSSACGHLKVPHPGNDGGAIFGAGTAFPSNEVIRPRNATRASVIAKPAYQNLTRLIGSQYSPVSICNRALRMFGL